ncbi:MAG: SufS family cysteine desulfurase [Myxococcota bacterium]
MDLKSQFPILEQTARGKKLVYLDSAATALKPLSVIEAERAYELKYCANIHRGVHYLSEQATDAFEQVRVRVQKFIGARSGREIIFTSGTTGGINLVANSFAKHFLKAGDEIWISSLEHHSNIVPWQMVCQQIGCVLKVIPLGHQGPLPFGPSAKLLAMSYASNALGVVNPVKEWTAFAKARGMTVLVDAAQAATHLPIDVKDLDCDFLVFSGHKLYGPTGTGVLYGREELLEKMPPYQTGGDMIEHVAFEKTTYAKLPMKFEAGTPNIAGVIGLGAAIDFVLSLGFEKMQAHESELMRYGFAEVEKVFPGSVRSQLHSPIPIISFSLGDIHPHDIASILDQEGIAIRAGHLCAQPLMRLLGVPALARASLGVYNTLADIDALTFGLKRVKQVFKC